MNNYHFERTNNSPEIVSLYPKEAAEHITDQIIKLSDKYERCSDVIARAELSKAMETLNESLKDALNPHFLIKGME
ncbi:hypothetical protein [Virgibacillus salexigens]|uniref:Uncharacterized protein n=2 Tax=Virgibacillus TaxID=84406 RepID=A0A024QBB1_9BACI|nr:MULTISPECIES: hypothetical protein [Virgibacillus]GGJ48622.1 hypothetical protein GCM10007111_08430 [Virgibacillus kapii]CDQ39532.1 hypothetical protein BN990_01837 [Virgibacillus massiliensis]